MSWSANHARMLESLIESSGRAIRKLFRATSLRAVSEAPARDHAPATGCAAGAPDTALRHIVTDLAVHIRVALPRHFSELAVFDARLYIGVRRIDEPA